MNIFNLVFVFCVAAFSAISIANEAAQHSMTQHDFSKTPEASTDYEFDKNASVEGAVTKMTNRDFDQNQHDLSQTYATSNEYDFADNPKNNIQLVSDKKVVFKQSQHDKSMSDF
ncbi:hypothetical protein [uncultured Shewanella sp.]|uniref:hypothetical protein n=1 Tax=uncultured Shewanella sp. TaxID=173975 RepID=UPI0026210BC6|nr:hypothetical protein [uncultured Shewanella sp.]